MSIQFGEFLIVDREEIVARLTTFVDTRITQVTHIDPEKMNVNAEPLYIGKLMLLSDQDGTALKHHALSSAVMGTVFVGLISTISNPEIPLLLRIVLAGAILTGLQAVLVGVTNLATSAWELWSGAGRPVPSPRFCVVCIGHFCVAVSLTSVRFFRGACGAMWSAYVQAHMVTLDNGTVIWIDLYGSVVLEAPQSDSEAS